MEGTDFDSSEYDKNDNNDDDDNIQVGDEANVNEEEKEKAVEEEKATNEEKEKEKKNEQEKQLRKDAYHRYGIERFLKERLYVEFATELIELINGLVADLQDISDAEAARDREDGAGLTGDDNGAIHTKDGAVHMHN